MNSLREQIRAIKQKHNLIRARGSIHTERYRYKVNNDIIKSIKEDYNPNEENPELLDKAVDKDNIDDLVMSDNEDDLFNER